MELERHVFRMTYCSSYALVSAEVNFGTHFMPAQCWSGPVTTSYRGKPKSRRIIKASSVEVEYDSAASQCRAGECARTLKKYRYGPNLAAAGPIEQGQGAHGTRIPHYQDGRSRCKT